jgi:hypothetical protein
MDSRRLSPVVVLFILLAAFISLAAAINRIQGLDAHDAVATGRPVQMGGVASTGLPAAVANGDAVRAYFDERGRQVVALGSALQASVDTVSPGANAAVDGLIPYRNAANATNGLLTNVAQTAKASAGRIYVVDYQNPNTSAVFIHFYDTGSTVTVGTTASFYHHMIPAGSATDPGRDPLILTIPITCGSAIKIAATTSADHTVSTAPATGLSGAVLLK